MKTRKIFLKSTSHACCSSGLQVQKTLAKLISISQHRLAQNTGRPIKRQFSFFQALLYLPAVDGSRLQCVSVILIWLVLVLTDLWELLVDLLYN